MKHCLRCGNLTHKDYNVCERHYNEPALIRRLAKQSSIRIREAKIARLTKQG